MIMQQINWLLCNTNSVFTGSLSVGAIVGIAVGGVVAVIIIIVVIVICCLKRRKKQPKKLSPPQSPRERRYLSAGEINSAVSALKQ